MSKICDRSPCDQFISVLGIWVFGTEDGDGFEIVAAASGEDEKLVRVTSDIEYCPFCGTRLSEVGEIMIEKFMRPRKRRRVTKMAVT